MYGEAQAAGMNAGFALQDMKMKENYEKLTVRDNIEAQIERAKKEVERLEGIRDRLAPELLDQRIVDLRQAMQF